MAQVINTNYSAINAQRNLNSSQGTLQIAIQRLSSGLRVNSAKDDAAGLAISERMNAQIKGMNAAARNANDALSLAQTAEGTLGQIGDTLQRMRELAVQSSNGTNNTGDRSNLDTEFRALANEITRVLGVTSFNNVSLLNNSSSLTFQIGSNNVSSTDQITVTLSNFTAGATSSVATAISTASSISTAGAAQTAIDNIDKAINEITTKRSDWGAMQNRFEAVVSNLNTAVENISAARGRIVDADFATETANMTRAQILQQAGTAMLAQANSLPQGVLSLLRG